MGTADTPSFVLVHGAWHDARVWDQVRDALDDRGCRSIAVDLPGDDVAVDASGYARVIAAAAGDLGSEPPVLVGHSLAGISIPLVPALVPVRRLIYLAALIPEPGRSMSDVQHREEPLGDTRGVARDARERSYWTSKEAVIQILYHDCDRALAEVAAARLRPQARTPHLEPCPLARFPDVPASYIVMESDRMVRPEWSRTTARRRLGVEPVELPGGHSPMLADPKRLADTLVTLGRADGAKPSDLEA